MNEKKCYGCGSTIQSTHKDRPGFLPEKANRGDHVLCQRCFKLLHYHEKMESHLTKDDFLSILQKIGEKDCLVVYLIDLFDFTGSMINGLSRHVGGNDILVLANKRDILPMSLKEHKLNMWVRRQLKNEGIKPVDVIVTSGKKSMNFDEIFDAIDKYRNHRDVFVVGMTNVGKSTFINKLLKHYSDTQISITTSEFPGTTLDLIEIPFDENSSLFDSPGIINEHQMTSIINEKDLKTIMPQSEIRPQSFQLNSKQTLYLSGLARIDYLDGEKGSFFVYASKSLKVHRCKLENADKLYNNHKELKLNIDNITTIDQMKTYEFNFNGERKEIVISGLGFVGIKAKGKVKVWVPKNIDVTLREPLIGG